MAPGGAVNCGVDFGVAEPPEHAATVTAITHITAIAPISRSGCTNRYDAPTSPRVPTPSFYCGSAGAHIVAAFVGGRVPIGAPSTLNRRTHVARKYAYVVGRTPAAIRCASSRA